VASPVTRTRREGRSVSVMWAPAAVTDRITSSTSAGSAPTWAASSSRLSPRWTVSSDSASRRRRTSVTVMLVAASTGAMTWASANPRRWLPGRGTRVFMTGSDLGGHTGVP